LISNTVFLAYAEKTVQYYIQEKGKVMKERVIYHNNKDKHIYTIKAATLKLKTMGYRVFKVDPDSNNGHESEYIFFSDQKGDRIGMLQQTPLASACIVNLHSIHRPSKEFGTGRIISPPQILAVETGKDIEDITKEDIEQTLNASVSPVVKKYTFKGIEDFIEHKLKYGQKIVEVKENELPTKEEIKPILGDDPEIAERIYNRFF